MMHPEGTLVRGLGLYDANRLVEGTWDDPGRDDAWACRLCGETDAGQRTSMILLDFIWTIGYLCATCVGAGPVEAAKRAHARAAAWRAAANALPRIDVYYELYEHAKELDQTADVVALIDPARWDVTDRDRKRS